MIYKTLGNTKIKVATIGMGTGYDFEHIKDTKVITDTLKKGIDLGLNLIDTAESYGNGLAEGLVGEVIQGKRDKVFIATKFSPENSDRINIRKSIEKSLRRLKTDYIDLYQFHWPNPSIPPEETIQTLKSFVDEGKIRFFGLGNFSTIEVEHALKVSKPFQPISVQTEYNLLERTIEQSGLLKTCEEKNISIIAYSPLDQGRLDALNEPQGKLIKKLSQKYLATNAQLILNWLIQKSPVIAIPKTKNEKHLLENYNSANLEIDKADIRLLNDAFFVKLEQIPVDKIRVSLSGEGNKQTYQTLSQAIKNDLKFVPSPAELAKSIKQANFLKPVRLKKLSKKEGSIEYDLIGGRIRYWAWVIAYGGKKPILAYVRDGV